jgi:hypothetical protein
MIFEHSGLRVAPYNRVILKTMMSNRQDLQINDRSEPGLGSNIPCIRPTQCADLSRYEAQNSHWSRTVAIVNGD